MYSMLATLQAIYGKLGYAIERFSYSFTITLTALGKNTQELIINAGYPFVLCKILHSPTSPLFTVMVSMPNKKLMSSPKDGLHWGKFIPPTASSQQLQYNPRRRSLCLPI